MTDQAGEAPEMMARLVERGLSQGAGRAACSARTRA